MFSPPLFNERAFLDRDPIPDVVLFPYSILILTNRDQTVFSAKLQITIPSDELMHMINISCATIGAIPGDMDNNVTSLIHECKFI